MYLNRYDHMALYKCVYYYIIIITIEAYHKI